jgi:hypothetical protein
MLFSQRRRLHAQIAMVIEAKNGFVQFFVLRLTVVSKQKKIVH